MHNKHIPALGGTTWAGEDQRAWCAKVGGRLQEGQGRSELVVISETSDETLQVTATAPKTMKRRIVPLRSYDS